MKKTFILLFVILSTNALANTGTVISQCGNFNLVAKVGETTRVNGEMVTSQKITELGDDGLKVEMTLMPARDGNMYGFEYIHPNGSNKRWLNVELIRGNMGEPRIIGSFDCKRISG